MFNQIFVNLPVKDLNQSVAFFTRLGFSFNPQFTDETATCMVVSEQIFVMLLTEEKFKSFSPKEICDTTKSVEVLVCLAAGSRDEVDETIAAALVAGGTTYSEAKDYGFMYQRAFQDLDGHCWDLVYMDPSAFQES